MNISGVFIILIFTKTYLHKMYNFEFSKYYLVDYLILSGGCKMNNVWLMKTFKDWSVRFLESTPPFIAIDEEGIDTDYGSMSQKQRQHLLDQLKEVNPSRHYGHIKRFFDDFYDEAGDNDLLVLGTGKTTKFFVTAIVRLKNSPFFYTSSNSKDSRHRFAVEILWRGTPFEVPEWGWANRLEKMDTPDRLKQFIKMYTQL